MIVTVILKNQQFYLKHKNELDENYYSFLNIQCHRKKKEGKECNHPTKQYKICTDFKVVSHWWFNVLYLFCSIQSCMYCNV